MNILAMIHVAEAAGIEFIPRGNGTLFLKTQYHTDIGKRIECSRIVNILYRHERAIVMALICRTQLFDEIATMCTRVELNRIMKMARAA